jgi:hypothetical protein
MRIFKHFSYTPNEQRWAVPEGVTSALFECWGAAGGMPSSLAVEGKVREVVGGTGPKNDSFFNNPHQQGSQLGNSFANNSGFAAGIRTVTPGDIYYVYVGGNGGPGHSTIKLKEDGTYEVAFRGGAAGYNGGGQGGDGAHITQNLYNSTNTNVHYKQNAMPNSAKSGQRWWDTGSNRVKTCNTTYTAGNGTAAKWDLTTHLHNHMAGPSGGGGGGATDIRRGDNGLANRILIAGGGGGAGGNFNDVGVSAWTLQRCPSTPSPPFGTDDLVSGATGPDSTWVTVINYLAGGWGGGGLGGATGPLPNPATTTDGGYATTADGGGPATDRHQDGVAPTQVAGSGGKGGTNVAGGARGQGGSGGQGGSKGSGGNGADADGGIDDWCAGGGGGGGGYYGGGGGGQGFKVHGDNSAIHTRGGGGGGGSNYVDPTFSQFILAGGAQPPFAKGNSGTGANGLGGFARISYHLPPKVSWLSAPRVATASAAFTATFTYAPAQSGGSGISYYIIGTATSPTATFPTSQTTFMAPDPTQTQFSASFTAPANGVTNAFFVQVVDLDGDASPWLRQQVTGLTPPTPVTITSPTAGAAFEGAVTVNWTVGASQTPLAAYRLGLTGQLATPLPRGLGSTPLVDFRTPWRRGGSRVNLWLDPGYAGTAVWSSTSNVNMTSQTTNPGVSGNSGKIAWREVEDFSAEQHSTSFGNLIPGTAYRLHIELASPLANDPRPIEVQVWDSTGMLTQQIADLSTTGANTYKALDIEFTPSKAQGIYFVLRPSATTPDPVLAPVLTEDWEGGTVNGWTANAGWTVTADNATPANIFQGDYGLKITGFAAGGLRAAQKTITSTMTTAALGAGQYVLQGYAFAPTGGDKDVAIRVGGAGVNGGTEQVGTTTTRNAVTLIRVPFTWDGAGAVTLFVDGNSAVSTGLWYDYFIISKADTSQRVTAYGNTDSGQITYVANTLLELKYEEDKSGYGTYFDGGHLNGNPGTASWLGTANASASIITGTNVVTGVLTYTGALTGSTLYIDTMNCNAINGGQDPVRASEAINVNPSAPPAPTVAMQVDSATGFVRLTINAADGASSTKTTYFDVYRNGARIVTNLTPDQTTRISTYMDVPAHGVVSTYLIRAFDVLGGWVDVTTGTVT